MKRCHLIANPTSGGYSSEKIDMTRKALAERGIEAELLLTGSAEDAAIFAARICSEETAPLIMVAGGDGTVNGVLNGLAPGRATLAVLPLGTSNVLARELQIRTLQDAVAKVAAGATRPISVGEFQSGALKRRFMLMAGIGLDGAVVAGVRLSEKRKLGKGAYLLSALRRLWHWDARELVLKANGAEVICHSAVICNAEKYGGDLRLAQGADLFRAGFQVVHLRGGRYAFLKAAALMACGRTPFSTFNAAEVEVSGEKEVQLDGDPAGCAPARFTALADFAQVIV